MNKIFKTFTLFACMVLVGQTTLVNVAYASEAWLSGSNEILTTNPSDDWTTWNGSAWSDGNITTNWDINADSGSGSESNNNSSESSSSNQCSSEVTSTFLNSLSDAINDVIESTNASGFKYAEASLDSNSIILYTDNEDVELPDLADWAHFLLDRITETEEWNKIMMSFWENLISKNPWLKLSIVNVTNLNSFNLGRSDTLYANFQDCSLPYSIELKVDNSSSEWDGNDNVSNKCNSEETSAFLNSLADTINWIIKESNNSEFKRAEASNDNDTLIIYVASQDTKLPDLTKYMDSLVDFIHERTWQTDIEYKFWEELADKNPWLTLNVIALTSLINLHQWRSNAFHIDFETCAPYVFNIELKVDEWNNDNTNSNNNGNGYSWWGGWGSWWSSSNNSSNDSKDNTNNTSKDSSSSNNTNDEELVLSWEVENDDIMEVKKAETCSIEWSTFSEEENQAYLRACEKWIIIADNIMKANMNRNLTRAELAKMMSVYSEQLLGRSRVISGSANYPDVNDNLGDLAYYIQEWYKLQIMWIHANGSALSKFSPSSLVTRWEFGTVFSRVLYGNGNNINSSKYYEKHLQALKNAGILENTNPKLKETRWWVIIMLYRSQKVEKSNWNISLEEVANISSESTTEESTTENDDSNNNSEVNSGTIIEKN